jgi:molecular chaperone GrpE
VTAPHEEPTVEEAQETAPPRPEDAEPQQVDQVVEEPVDEPVDELVAAQQALAERTLDLQRLQAEYLNYKRRVDRDRELIKQNAVFAVLNNLLPVLDDIDRAAEHGELEGGFKAVADSLERTVSGLGLTRFGAPGDEFDPNQHEALMHGHSPEVTTTTVGVVAQAGYRIGDRVVRAAKVTVLDPEPTGTDS